MIDVERNAQKDHNARLQINDTNLVAPSVKFKPFLCSDISSNITCTKSNSLDLSTN